MEATSIPLDIQDVLAEPTADEIFEYVKVIASLGIAQDKLRFTVASAMQKIAEKFPNHKVLGVRVNVETYKLLGPCMGWSGSFLGIPFTPVQDVEEGSIQLDVELGQ